MSGIPKKKRIFLFGDSRTEVLSTELKVLQFLKEQTGTVEMPPCTIVDPSACSEEIAAVTMIKTTSIDTKAMSIEDVVISTESLLAGHCIGKGVSHGDTPLLWVIHKGGDPSVDAPRVVQRTEFAA